MPSWNYFRASILILIFGTSVFVFIKKNIFTSSYAEPNVNGSRLPVSIPLQGWESASSRQLDDHLLDSSNYRAAREYRYIQGPIQLKSQARYMVQTDGDIKRFISDNPSLSYLMQEDWETRHSDESGSYFLILTSKGIHLSSCVNPHGMSTVSTQDYKWNRNFQDIRYRFLPWLLGEPLKDERCLWTHMSISSNDPNSKDLIPILEMSWEIWYRWWSIKLPRMEG